MSGPVMAASTGEESGALLQRLPGRPINDGQDGGGAQEVRKGNKEVPDEGEV